MAGLQFWRSCRGTALEMALAQASQGRWNEHVNADIGAGPPKS
jgi:hypothetical protein